MTERTTTAGRPTATAVALVATLGLAGVAWIVVVRRMRGMDLGTMTELGSFAPFLAGWVAMMAAMMLPGAAPAVARHAVAAGRLRAVLFAESYLAVWALVGMPVYVLYRPHGGTVAGVLVLAAAVYELTPLKRHFRRRCDQRQRSGFRFGLACVGSSLGLMLAQVAVGVMSVPWMCAVTVVVTAQKLLPPRAVVDVPVALAIGALGIGLLVGAVPVM
jgi:predicted metal-binding membrane protein